MFVPATIGGSNRNYGGAHCRQMSSHRAALRGGHLNSGATYGSLVALDLHNAPSLADTYIGFRGVC